MRATKLASKIHKWLALVIGVQIIVWFASGWFLSFFPIAQVRGEHLKREVPASLMDASALGAPLARILAKAGPISRIEVIDVLGKPVVLVEAGSLAPRLYDVTSGRRVSPLSIEMAHAVARADYANDSAITRTLNVLTASPEYRGQLPAWRIEFADADHTALYVARDTGKVTARLTDLWRWYDFLWGLHIMDWREHDNINHWWLWAAAGIGLIIAVSGVVLMPSRLGWPRRRRRLMQRAAPID